MCVASRKCTSGDGLCMDCRAKTRQQFHHAATQRQLPMPLPQILFGSLLQKEELGRLVYVRAYFYKLVKQFKTNIFRQSGHKQGSSITIFGTALHGTANIPPQGYNVRATTFSDSLKFDFGQDNSIRICIFK